MNLIGGKLVHEAEISGILDRLPELVCRTMEKPPLEVETVISACDRLVNTLGDDEVLPILRMLDFSEDEAKLQLKKLRFMFSRAYLTARIERELGVGYQEEQVYQPPEGGTVRERLVPHGVLFHIAAGNLDALPVLTVIEGLLTGNINLLKLPSVDGGLSIMILQRLFSIAPELAEYVYVFDMASTEQESLRRLADIANAVVVWGGDKAVQAVRKMASANTCIIEWGHKISFAYVTETGWKEYREKLQGVAQNICSTNQLLCSSCQGILLDTDNIELARAFCAEFTQILFEEAERHPPVPISAAARQTLWEYADGLERIYGGGSEKWSREGVSVVLLQEGKLRASNQFRHPWVQMVSQAQLTGILRPMKQHLQTATLICGDEERAQLEMTLFRAGVVQLTRGIGMSETYCGAPHDGKYTLREYMRRVSSWES